MNGRQTHKTTMVSYRRAVREAARQDMRAGTSNGGFPTTDVAALISNLFEVSFSQIHADIKRIIYKARAEFNGPMDTDSSEFKEWWDKNCGE